MSKDVDNGSGGDLCVLSSMSFFTCEQNYGRIIASVEKPFVLSFPRSLSIWD
jgi:hypothetical protein